MVLRTAVGNLDVALLMMTPLLDPRRLQDRTIHRLWLEAADADALVGWRARPEAEPLVGRPLHNLSDPISDAEAAMLEGPSATPSHRPQGCSHRKDRIDPLHLLLLLYHLPGGRDCSSTAGNNVDDVCTPISSVFCRVLA